MSQAAEQLSLAEIPAAPAIPPLPEQEISTEVLIEKYAKGNEINVHDVRRRVARALAAMEAEKTGLTGKHACSGPRKTASCLPGGSTPPPAPTLRRP